MKRKCWMIFGIFAAITIWFTAAAAQAAPVGKFIMVQGHVDLLKQGKLPALAAKVNDGVEPGDVIRTKSRSKAQVQFMDDTSLTLGAESRMAVADFAYDGRQRRATLNLYRGIVHTVVNKILQVQEPDFIMQTTTAAVGVRGTEWYTLVKPNSTLVYLPVGRLAVETRNPHFFILDAGFWLEAFKDRLTAPRRITPMDINTLEKLMDSGVPESQDFQVTPGGPPAGPGITMPKDPESGLPLYVPPIYQMPIQRDKPNIITPGPGQK